jgi:hypothetical protein
VHLVGLSTKSIAKVIQDFKNPTVNNQNSQQNSLDSTQNIGSIFPNSKMKDVVYHGTTEFNGNKFSRDKIGGLSEGETSKIGFHFSDKETATG